MKKITTWFKELSRLGKIAVVTAVLMVGGTMLNAAASPQTPVADTVEAEPKVEEKKPEVTTKTVEETQAVPFETQTVDDAGMASGTTSVRTEGVDGVRTISYKVTYTDGEETDRVQTSDEVTTPPVAKVIANGTYVAPKPKPAPVAASGCDPNYSGCVPIASDVDCASGSGNGPAYVAGPVQVTGVDIYDLDRNGDGWGCE